MLELFYAYYYSLYNVYSIQLILVNFHSTKMENIQVISTSILLQNCLYYTL